MAYFDTEKSAGLPNVFAPLLRRLAQKAAARVIAAMRYTSKSPENLIAAQKRSELARRAVDDLMR